MNHAPAFLKLVEEVMPRVREVTLAELRATVGDFHLIDVREDHEWQKGCIPGAEHMGRGIIERDIEARIPDKSAKIIAYCGGGFRSALVADSLQKMGYTNVFSLAGGWRAYCEAR